MGFGQSSSKLFFVGAEDTDAGLSPCSEGDYGTPGHGESQFAPVCSPEPSVEHFNAYGHGTDKRTHSQLMVTAGLTGQEGDVHLSHLIELVKEVISGTIH